MNSYIRYDALIFSPEFYEMKLEIIKNKKENKKKPSKKKCCWYCERECNTFISICELCQKYKIKK